METKEYLDDEVKEYKQLSKSLLSENSVLKEQNTKLLIILQTNKKQKQLFKT